MKLEDRLPEALQRIADASPVGDPGTFDPAIRWGNHDHRRVSRSKRPLVVAAAFATFGIGGAVAVKSVREPDMPATSDGPPPASVTSQATSPPITAPPEPLPAEPGPAGALVLPFDSGMSATGASVGSFAGNSPSRWYSTSVRQPEMGPYLRILSYENGVPEGADPGCMLAAQTTEVVLDDGTTACVEARSDQERLGRIGFWQLPNSIIIEGSVANDELIAAANNVVASDPGSGFEILPAGLPQGVEQTGAGWNVSDFAAVSFVAADDPMVSTHWIDNTQRTIFGIVTTDDTAWLGNHRLGFERVSDVTVRGVPGFIRTHEDQPNYVGLVWHDDGLTYLYGSQGFAEAELVALVDQMEPASQADWNATVAAVPEPDVMSEELPATTSPLD